MRTCGGGACVTRGRGFGLGFGAAAAARDARVGVVRTTTGTTTRGVVGARAVESRRAAVVVVAAVPGAGSGLRFATGGGAGGGVSGRGFAASEADGPSSANAARSGRQRRRSTHFGCRSVTRDLPPSFAPSSAYVAKSVKTTPAAGERRLPSLPRPRRSRVSCPGPPPVRWWRRSWPSRPMRRCCPAWSSRRRRSSARTA